jgi:hypothetical protein
MDGTKEQGFGVAEALHARSTMDLIPRDGIENALAAD